MAKSLQNAIIEIQKKCSRITGINASPVNVTEGVAVYPYSICFARSGTLISSREKESKALHTLICELHFARGMLTGAIEQSMPFVESFPDALYDDPKLND
jgi:hypothetical protein